MNGHATIECSPETVILDLWSRKSMAGIALPQKAEAEIDIYMLQ